MKIKVKLLLIIFSLSMVSITAQEESLISIGSGFLATKHGGDDFLNHWKNGYLININYSSILNDNCNWDIGVSFINYFSHRENYDSWRIIGELSSYNIDDLRSFEINSMLNFKLYRGIIYPKLNIGIGCSYLFDGTIKETIRYYTSDVNYYEVVTNNAHPQKIFVDLLFGVGIGFRILDKLDLLIELRSKFMLSEKKEYTLLIPFIALLKYNI